MDGAGIPDPEFPVVTLLQDQSTGHLCCQCEFPTVTYESGLPYFEKRVSSTISYASGHGVSAHMGEGASKRPGYFSAPITSCKREILARVFGEGPSWHVVATIPSVMALNNPVRRI